MTKIGITGFSGINLEEIFESYDLNNNQTLDYKEFVGALYSNGSIAKIVENEGKIPAKKYNEGSKFAFLEQKE